MAVLGGTFYMLKKRWDNMEMEKIKLETQGYREAYNEGGECWDGTKWYI